MILREFITKWGFDVDDADLKKLDAGISRVEKNLRAAGKMAVQTGKSLSLGLTLPILGIGAAALKAASDAEETEAKFGTVFQEVSKEADMTAKNLARGFGLSSVKAKELLGDTGDLLTGFGFSGKAALDLSKDVNELAVDLASFTNFSGGAEGASKALTKALLGERESIKSLGISIQEEDLKKQIQINTSKGLTFETQRQAKAFATLQLAQKQSKNAIGDFQRTSEGFANQLRIFQGELFDVAVGFGKILIPPALKFLKILRNMAQFFGDLSPAVKTTIAVVAGLAAAIGPLLILAGSLVNAFFAVKTALLLLNLTAVKSLFLLALPFLKIIALVALVGLVMEDIIGFFQGKDSVTGVIVESFKEAFEFVEGLFSKLPRFFQGIFGLVTTPFRALIGLIRGTSGAIGALTQGDFSGALDAIGSAALDVLNPFENGTSISSALGFGREDKKTITPSPQLLGTGANNTNQSINAPININVPEGTTPDQVGPAVQKGVADGLADILRQTQRQTLGPVVN